MFDIFREPFMRVVLSGTLIAAVTCAYLGVFMILKRVVFMGIALSQAAALGVAAGLYIGLNPVVSSLVLTLTAIVLFWLPFSEKNISRESVLGLAYAFSAGIAVILIAKNPMAESRGLNLVSGNLIYMTHSDLAVLAGAAVFAAAAHFVFFKEFIFVSFDRETARAAGLSASFLDLLLYLTIGVAISFSMMVCGVVFVFASLVIPAMTAIFIAGSIGKIFLTAGIIASIGVVSGLALSYVWDLPSGPAITGTYGILFMVLSGVKVLFCGINIFREKDAE